jgi:hypothetical protein
VSLRVDQMFVFLAVDHTGDEGVIAYPMGNTIMPLLGADMARVDSVRTLAQKIADARGCDITLAVFSVRENREVIRPRGYKPKG